MRDASYYAVNSPEVNALFDQRNGLKNLYNKESVYCGEQNLLAIGDVDFGGMNEIQKFVANPFQQTTPKLERIISFIEQTDNDIRRITTAAA